MHEVEVKTLRSYGIDTDMVVIRCKADVWRQQDCFSDQLMDEAPVH